MSAELKIDTVENDIAQAMEEVANKEPKDDDAPADNGTPEKPQEPADEDKSGADKPAKDRDETGKFTKSKEKVDVRETPEQPPEPAAVAAKIPHSVPAALREKWAKTPPEIQSWLTKREEDQHKELTAPDGALRMGREMKEIITPYMPIIQAEGGTPAKAVSDLLNTAYVLRTGNAQQKVNMVHQIAKTYGIDLGQVQQPQPQLDPAMQQILQRIDGIENKFTEQMTLQERQEHDRIMSEVASFSANPANVYFEQLKPVMAPLLASGQAKDLQEAYDKACWSDPVIRSTLLEAQKAEETEKRRQEVAKKKNAGSSVTGSPGVKSASSTPNNNSVEDDIRSAMDDILP